MLFQGKKSSISQENYFFRWFRKSFVNIVHRFFCILNELEILTLLSCSINFDSFIQIFIKFIYDYIRTLYLWEKILLIIFEFEKQNSTKIKKKGIDYYPGNRKYSTNLLIFFSSIFLKIFRAIFFCILILIDPRVRVRNVFDIPSHAHDQSNGSLPSFHL